MTTDERIKAKIESLRERRRAILFELRTLDTQVGILNEMLEPSKASDPQVTEQPSIAADKPKRIRGRGVTYAVATLLAKNPNGLRDTAIVDMLKDAIETESPDRPRIVRNTLINMKKRGTVVEVDGVYRVAASNGSQQVDLEDLF